MMCDQLDNSKYDAASICRTIRLIVIWLIQADLTHSYPTMAELFVLNHMVNLGLYSYNHKLERLIYDNILLSQVSSVFWCIKHDFIRR